MKSQECRVICLILASLALGGCSNGLMKVMEEYHFIPLSPPQTQWEGGSIVEVQPQDPNAPVLRITPTMAGAKVTLVNSLAPDVSRSHSDKFDISLGLTLPQGIGVQLKEKGASQYTVVADGNFIIRVPLDPYAGVTFPAIKKDNEKYWGRALADKVLFYVYELWYCRSLEYKFYNESGTELAVDAKAIKIPVELSTGYSATDSGTVVYKGQDPICLGYKVRPVVRRDPDGILVAEGTGEVTSKVGQARFIPYVKSK